MNLNLISNICLFGVCLWFSAQAVDPKTSGVFGLISFMYFIKVIPLIKFKRRD
jgi:hypothetical protein